MALYANGIKVCPSIIDIRTIKGELYDFDKDMLSSSALTQSGWGSSHNQAWDGGLEGIDVIIDKVNDFDISVDYQDIGYTEYLLYEFRGEEKQYTLVGTPTDGKEYLSNFSATNYATYDDEAEFDTTDTSYIALDLHFKLDTINTNQTIISTLDNSYLNVGVDSANKVVVNVNGNSYTGSEALITGIDYNVTVTLANKRNLFVDLSYGDCSNSKQIISQTSATDLIPAITTLGDIGIGVDKDKSTPFGGYYNILKSSIYISDKNGTRYVRAYEKQWYVKEFSTIPKLKVSNGGLYSYVTGLYYLKQEKEYDFIPATASNNGCLINYTDDGSKHTFKAYVFYGNTSNILDVKLVNGNMTDELLYGDYTHYVYLKDVTIQEHNIGEYKTAGEYKYYEEDDFETDLTPNYALEQPVVVKNNTYTSSVKDILTYNRNNYLVDYTWSKDDESKYTVVGNPTISEKVASNFSASNYLVGDTDLILGVKSFVQPTLTSNGTMGVSDVAVSGSQHQASWAAYNVFNDNGTPWHTANSASKDLTMYFKNKLNVTNFKIRNRSDDPSCVYPISSVRIYGSDDNSTWTLLNTVSNSVTASNASWDAPTNSSEYYHYYKLSFVNSYSYCALSYIKITATEWISRDWEINTKVKFTSNTCEYFGNYLEEYKYLKLYINDGKPGLAVSFDGTTWGINQTSTTSLSLNTWYYIKTYFNGTQYCIDVSADNETYTNYLTITNSSIINGTTKIGIGKTYNSYMLGSIDLKNCYIKVDNSLLWSAEKITEETENFTRVGSPTISNHVLSNINNSNYIKSNVNAPSSPSNYDMIFKLKSTDLSSGHNVIISRDSGTEQYFGIRTTEKFAVYNGSWTEGTTTVEVNQVYWFRVIYNGTNCVCYSLLDNNYTLNTLPDISSWTQEFTTTNWFNNILFRIGSNYAVNVEYFRGYIYLNDVKITVNGETWWTPYIVQEEHYGYKKNYSVVGSPTITTDNVVSGFSGSNYLTFPNKFEPGTNTWELCYKIRTGSDLNVEWIQGSTSAIDHQIPLIGVNGARWCLHLSSNGSNWNIADSTAGSYVVQTNTVYWVKCVYNGSSYVLSYSLDGNNWITDVTINNSTPIYQTPTAWPGWGINKYNSSSSSWQIFSGTIYLNESYIKVNGEIWWSVYKLQTLENKGCLVNYIDDGSATTLNAYACKMDNGTNRMLLSPSDFTREEVTDKELIGSVSIPKHDVYNWNTVQLPWTQPTLTSNGTLGGASCAAASSSNEGDLYAYKAFDNSSSTGWNPSGSGNPQWLTFYTPTPILVSKVVLTFREIASSGKIQGSNDNTNWVDLGSFTNNSTTPLTINCNSAGEFYKYIRFYKTGNLSGWGGVYHMSITAQYITSGWVKVT